MGFLPWSAQNCKKCSFLDNLRTTTPEGYIGGLTNYIFHLPFPLLLFLTFIFVFENSQNSFSYASPFCLFRPVKYLNFGGKLSFWTPDHTFLERRHPEVTKNPNYVVSPKWKQKNSSWTTDAATVNPNGIKTLLAIRVSTFF